MATYLSRLSPCPSDITLTPTHPLRTHTCLPLCDCWPRFLELLLFFYTWWYCIPPSRLILKVTSLCCPPNLHPAVHTPSRFLFYCVAILCTYPSSQKHCPPPSARHTLCTSSIWMVLMHNVFLSEWIKECQCMRLSFTWLINELGFLKYLWCALTGKALWSCQNFNLLKFNARIFWVPIICCENTK